MFRILFVVAGLAALAGCETTAPLRPVTYNGKATVVSSNTATISFETGIVTGSEGTTIIQVGMDRFEPVSTGPTPHLHFDMGDQQVFVDSLASELLRLGILGQVWTPETQQQAPDLVINVAFAKTHHDPNNNAYTLDVTMQIDTNGLIFAEYYNVVSTEGDSLWDKWNTGSLAGKTRAAEMLMIRLVQDIQDVIAER